jgi:hypothetical protein
MAERRIPDDYDNGPVDPYGTYYRSGYYYPVNTVRPGSAAAFASRTTSYSARNPLSRMILP